MRITNRLIILVLTLVAIVTVLFPKEGFAQSGPFRLFIPTASVAGLGHYPEIQPEDCEKFGLAATQRYFSNGTSFFTIAREYHIFTMDIRDLNQDFFPNLVVDSVTGNSRICLYRNYNKTVLSDNVFLNWKEGVPGWQSNLWGNDVMASEGISDTYTILGFTIAADTWWGAPVVGTLEGGGEIWGTIIKRAGTASSILGKAIAIYVPLAALIDRVEQATTYGLAIPGTVLDGNVAIIYYSIEPGLEEEVYIGFFADAISKAENMNVPDVIRLYTLGEDGFDRSGLVVSRVPLGIPGEKAYQWQVVKATATKLVAQRKRYSQSHYPNVIKDVEEFLDYQYNKRFRPAPIPTDPNGECIRLSGDNYLIAEALYLSIEEAAYRMRNTPRIGSLHNVIEFVDAAREFLPVAVLADWYETPMPRRLLAKAHYTTQMDNPDPSGYHWTVQVFCGIVGGRYEWLLDPDEGRLKTSITSQFPVYVPIDPVEPRIEEDFVEKYAYQYLDN